MKTYVRFQQVFAEPCDLHTYEKKTGKNPMKDKTKGNMPGYTVINENGFSRWVEKLTFDKSFAPADTWRERLVVEFTECTQRIEKLSKYIESMKEENKDKILMIAQLNAMQTYASIMAARLE